MSDERDFEQLAQDLDRLESVTEQWTAEQRATVEAIRKTIETIQVGAFKRMIRSIKDAPGGLEALKTAVQDDWVRAVLTFHGVLRPPDPTPEERIEAALESVRPMLASHDGNVHLVEVVSEEEVHIRLEGSCDGCTHSDITVRQGIETAIKEAVTTVQRVKVVNTRRADALVQIDGITESPFAGKWEDAGALDALSDGEVMFADLSRASVMITLHDGEPKAYRNACAHLGMPLDDGKVDAGVIRCPFHGFEFLLESGECLTAPQIQLPVFPARVEDGRILVQVAKR